MALSRRVRRSILCAIDAVLILIAFAFAYTLGLAIENLGHDLRVAYFQQFTHLAVFVVMVRLVLFVLFGLYRGIVRFAGLYELAKIGVATLLGTVLFAGFDLYLYLGKPTLSWLPSYPDALRSYVVYVPPRVVILEGMLTFLAIGGLRFSRRLLFATGLLGARTTGRNLLIIGVGSSAERVCRELAYDPDSDYRPVAIIDPDHVHVGDRVHGVPVVGGIESLGEAIQRYAVAEVLIALPEASPSLLRRIVAECKATRVSFKQVPSLADLMAGKVMISDLRPVEIEDLLGRPAVQLSLSEEQNYLRGECVLVTGAGGSIGAELCRQIRRYGPSRLILLGRGENSIYEIATELGYRFDGGGIELVIADIRDRGRIERVFEQYRPAVVYHAAAHKHVPLMELHPEEAVTNNIFGTEIVAQAADRFGVKVFILISTDKAVRPTNVMGASKRVAEMVVREIGRRSQAKFLTVRFGNVLGSRGSVVPLFKRQIAAGGPVTVTDLEATRYCMTIPEAVSLVIQTGALRERGTLFLLDMGEPVRVIDLARNLITLSGLEPDIDIAIEVIGLRPGEKLREQLLTEGEGVQRTEVGKVFVTQPDAVDAVLLQRELDALRRALSLSKGRETILASLRRLVPEFRRAEEGGAAASPAGPTPALSSTRTGQRETS